MHINVIEINIYKFLQEDKDNHHVSLKYCYEILEAICHHFEWKNGKVDNEGRLVLIFQSNYSIIVSKISIKKRDMLLFSIWLKIIFVNGIG